MGTSLTRFIQLIRDASASLIGAAAVSTILTAVVALPMGVGAVQAADDPIGLHDEIALDDVRFPDAVPLGDEQLEILEFPQEPQEIAAPAITETPIVATATPTEPAATATPELPEQFAIVLPTPTTQPPPIPTARPVPTSTPVPEVPTPLAPTPTAEPTATPTADPTTPPEELDAGSTDVYAYVTGPPLREREVGNVDVKAVNGGGNATVSVTVTVSVAGADILSVTPQRAGWTCAGGASSWQCSGPDLEAEGYSRNVVALVPEGDDVTVSVAVSHGVPDEAPGNNALSAQVPVIPAEDDGVELGPEATPPEDGDIGGELDSGIEDPLTEGGTDGGAETGGDGSTEGGSGDGGTAPDDAPADDGSGGSGGEGVAESGDSTGGGNGTGAEGEGEPAAGSDTGVAGVNGEPAGDQAPSETLEIEPATGDASGVDEVEPSTDEPIEPSATPQVEPGSGPRNEQPTSVTIPEPADSVVPQTDVDGDGA